MEHLGDRNYRLTFSVNGEDVWDIDFEDYHGK
jgi:plasmid maintenance system killer protein